MKTDTDTPAPADPQWRLPDPPIRLSGPHPQRPLFRPVACPKVSASTLYMSEKQLCQNSTLAPVAPCTVVPSELRLGSVYYTIHVDMVDPWPGLGAVQVKRLLAHPFNSYGLTVVAEVTDLQSNSSESIYLPAAFLLTEYFDTVAEARLNRLQQFKRALQHDLEQPSHSAFWYHTAIERLRKAVYPISDYEAALLPTPRYQIILEQTTDAITHLPHYPLDHENNQS